MKDQKKTVKGMTLVEVVISLFVFGIAALIMVRVGTVVNNLEVKSNHTNRKVVLQAPLAENGVNMLTIDDDKLNDDDTPNANYGNVDAINNDYIDGPSGTDPYNLHVSMTVGSSSVSIRGSSYSTADAVSGNQTTSKSGGGNLQFVYIPIEYKTNGANVWTETPEEGE